MLLNLTQMKQITKGVARIEEENGEFYLLRFTAAQTEAYRASGNMDFLSKTFATSGVRLALRTDSCNLSFDYRLKNASSRTYAWFDIYVNGHLIRHFGTEGAEITSGHACISLQEGIKDVEVYLPWSRAAILSNVELDDGALVEALNRKHTMICFGDSITQGYDAIYPSLSYVCALSRMLDADSVDKGIGGDRFFPALLAESDGFEPQIVTVAYGTNDWGFRTYDDYKQKSRDFYKRLSELYPRARIFGISPICRMDAEKKTPYGAPAYEIDQLLREVCEDLPNVTMINGWALTPNHKSFYSDFYLHPNDLGFTVYAQNLYCEISKHL